MIIEFVKMHGLGNDFIFVNDLSLSVEDPSGKARDLCRRRWSVGADGLILVQPSQRGDYLMRIFNADGSEAEMCGNALRCMAYYLQKHFHAGNELTIEVGGTLKKTKIMPDGMVRVNMEAPVLQSEQIPVTGSSRTVINEDIIAGGRVFKHTAVSMGNPHCVIYPESMEGISLDKYGPLLENHNMFPQRTNVEFVEVINSKQIRVHVWERGAGKTLACGTGACASVVAGIMLEKLDREHSVETTLPGGTLRIYWGSDGDVYMEGPAEEVFSGEVESM